MKVSTRKKVACLIVVSCTTIHTTVVGFTIPTTLSTRQGTQRFSSPPQTHPASKDSTCQSGESSSWTRQSTRLYYGTSSLPSETPRGEARRPFPRVDHEANGSTSSTTQKSQEQGIGQQDFRNAIQWTMGWVAAATTFGLGLAVFEGLQASQEYFTTYLLELSLSVDNLMVFMYLFQQFQIPTQYQNKVLNWGIGGAMIFRAIMIGLGTSVMHRLHGVQLAFAAMLLITAFQLATKQISTKSSNTNKSTSSTSTMSMDATMTTSKMNFARDCRDEAKNFYENKVRFSPTLDGDRFFTRTKFGELLPTPLFQCLAAVEGADIAFAMDSIPAGLAVTTVSAGKNIVDRLKTPLVLSMHYFES